MIRDMGSALLVQSSGCLRLEDPISPARVRPSVLWGRIVEAHANSPAIGTVDVRGEFALVRNVHFVFVSDWSSAALTEDLGYKVSLQHLSVRWFHPSRACDSLLC